MNKNEYDDIPYPKGGYPLIKNCDIDFINKINSLKPREFSSNSLMSISNMLKSRSNKIDLQFFDETAYNILPAIDEINDINSSESNKYINGNVTLDMINNSFNPTNSIDENSKSKESKSRKNKNSKSKENKNSKSKASKIKSKSKESKIKSKSKESKKESKIKSISKKSKSK